MKKVYYIVIGMLFMISLNVKAEKLDYYLSTKELNYGYLNEASQKVTNVKRGDYIYVTSVINNKEEAGELALNSGKITVRWEKDYLKLVNYDGDKLYSLTNSDYNVTVDDVKENDNKITINYTSSDKIKSGSNRLIAFKFQVLDTAGVGNTKIYEMDGEDSIACKKGEEVSNCASSLYTELKYYIESSDINTLSSIKLDGHNLDNFNENTKSYDVEVEGQQESINVEAIKKDEKSAVSGDLGTKELKYGINTLRITVTSESGKDNTYTLNIKRLDNRSSENTLSSLKLSNGIINFKPEVNDYNINVTNDIEKITITSTLKDEKAKYEEDYSNKDVTLSEGINKFQIKIIAENGDENIYNLNITRELSSNNTLKEIIVNNTPLEVKENEFYYSYEVENDVTKVTVSVKPTNEKAEVEVDPVSTLEEGENEIGIIVTAPNGNTVSYNLTVIRKKMLSNDAYLKDIKIDGYKLNFNKETKYYNLKIKKETELKIEPIKEDENSEVTIEGNKNLIDGSIIKINVKAPDGTIIRYFINIEKKSGTNILFWIFIAILIIMMITVITVLYMKKNDKKKHYELEKDNSEGDTSSQSVSDEKEVHDDETVNSNSTDNSEENINDSINNVLVDNNEIDDTIIKETDNKEIIGNQTSDTKKVLEDEE